MIGPPPFAGDAAPSPIDGGGTAVDTVAVEVRDLVKQYGALKAVDDLDLTVPTGGIFGLIGPNGAGKTTTMLAIVTLLQYDRGSITVFGADPARDPYEVRRLVGYMPDFFGLYDGLTCREYLDFFASTYHLEAATRRAQVRDLLQLVELDHKADTDVSGLSRGMQQRLSLARALVHDPKLLVLDEPASGLDPRARVELREILLELSRMGHTILVSSHILAELEEICDRVGIIEAGKVLAQGTIDEIQSGLATARTVTVRVLGGEEAVQMAVDTLAAAGAPATVVAAGVIKAELTGGDEAAADLLATLVGAGVRITDFREERGGLERLFLSVTKGVVR